MAAMVVVAVPAWKMGVIVLEPQVFLTVTRWSALATAAREAAATMERRRTMMVTEKMEEEKL
jgi:hypothetical protein